MKTRTVLDVSKLPTVGFGTQAPLWWGVWGLFAIEGTMFALVLTSYFYLRLNFKAWPPPHFGLPDLGPATWNTIILILSVWPMRRIEKAAMKEDRRRVQIGLVIGSLIGLVCVVLRCYEFPALKTRWDSHAYGSVVWSLLGLHLFHLLTSTGENILLAVYAFRREIDEKHQLDLVVNSLYWYFVVASWLPIYTVVYFAPRWLN